ncbi:MAG: tRNA-specific 2-thiouridylase MnmA [Elusimicrobia bacterium ADurb.Bin231]|nr:MAG: tRNA-specific 2-thiouridylase MnmA [Elusimicrobia bacterium ADurb.Bin231]
MAKCLLLFSGGLDSILSAKILSAQNIEITLLSFKSHFFGSDIAQKTACNLGLPLKILDFGIEHLAIVKHPEFGRGKGLNPCIDCHLLMLKTAAMMMRESGYDFIATGDVLDERPFSQNRRVFALMDKEGAAEGLVLRPLSAKLLDITIPEKLGIVNREALYDFSGKSRVNHIELACRLGINEYPTPAGGCILTDKIYSAKLSELFRNVPDCSGRDCELLSKGRVFWIDGFLCVLGRNEQENKNLEVSCIQGDIFLNSRNFSGPSGLIRSFNDKSYDLAVETAKCLIKKYSKKLPLCPEIAVDKIL